MSHMLNALGLLGISAILGIAFLYQFVLHEIPCPLCLLQRMAFCIMGLGLVLNLTAGARPAHYAMVIVSAVAGGVFAGRQVLLHIVPGTGAYGSPLFGLHFYSWAFIVFLVAILAAAAMLAAERPQRSEAHAAPRLAGLALVAVGAFAGLALLNGLATFVECGIGLCPDDPTGYQLLPS